MQRRDFLKYGSTAAIAFTGGLNAPVEAGSNSRGDRPPNVLLLVVDQLRADMCGCYGNNYCSTPNIDSLASRGVTFTRAYCPFPQCSPSRGSLMTGLQPQKTGIQIQPGPNQLLDERLLKTLPSLGTIFKGAGYRTGYIGKWHLSPRDTAEELKAYGFDSYSPRPRAPQDRRGFNLSDESRPYFGGPLAGFCSVSASWEEKMTESALHFLDDQAAHHQEQPFLLVYSDPRPHPPYLLPELIFEKYAPQNPVLWPNLRDDLADKPLTHRRLRDRIVGKQNPSDEFWISVIRHYSAVISALDDQIGRILKRLEERGLDENTIVVMLSDHGDLAGAHGFFSKGVVPYEELLRVPLIVSYPGKPKAGTKCTELVGIYDVLPTLIEETGIGQATSEMDGMSLVPFLGGGTQKDWREYLHVTHLGNIYGRTSMDVLITEDYKYVHYAYDSGELYNRLQDPWELRNLIDEPEESRRVADLYRILTSIVNPNPRRPSRLG